MDSMPMRAYVLLVLAALLVWASPPARADTQACTVLDTLPATITVPGRYCLEQNFVQAFEFGDAITINADDVVLDCNDHQIRATSSASNATGISTSNARRNVEVRNCQLDNFYVGMVFTGGVAEPGAVGNRIIGNTILRTRQVAMYVIGSANLVEGNRIALSSGNVNGVVYGIYMYSPAAQGVGNVIRGNHISDIKPTPPGDGNTVEAITFFNVRNTEVSGNVISGMYANTNWGTYGIKGSQTSHNTITGNVVLSPPPLAAPLDGGFYVGILMSGTAEEQATNVCTDNVVGHFNTNVNCGTEVGNTEF